jgi:tetratricopeptide (TPR) repeat protein
VKQITEALQYAHDCDLIHRDLKPENLLVGENNQILLSDFGLAAIAHGTTSLETTPYGGTTPYSAPEQIQGKPRKESDQYALGIIVYEWLSGERPFSGTLPQVISQHLYATPSPLREKIPGISSLVEAVVMRALAKDYHQRFPSVQEFALTLEQASTPTLPAEKPGGIPDLKTKEEWLQEGHIFTQRKQAMEALAAYGQALRLDPNFSLAYNGKGNALRALKRMEEALAAYEQALRLDPNYAVAYHNKGIALSDLKRYEQAIYLDPNYAPAYNNKGNALYNLKRYEEALAAFEQAIYLDPNFASAYNDKGAALGNLKRYGEAQQAYQKARQLG